MFAPIIPTNLYFFLSFFFGHFAFSRAAPTAYEGSQARGLIGAIAATATWDITTSATYTIAHSNAGSLSH